MSSKNIWSGKTSWILNFHCRTSAGTWTHAAYSLASPLANSINPTLLCFFPSCEVISFLLLDHYHCIKHGKIYFISKEKQHKVRICSFCNQTPYKIMAVSSPLLISPMSSGHWRWPPTSLTFRSQWECKHSLFRSFLFAFPPTLG